MKLLGWQQDNIKQLEFAVNLCRVDLDSASAGDWLNVKDGLFRFLYPGRGTDEVSKALHEYVYSKTLATLTNDVVREIQDRVKQVLMSISEGATKPGTTVCSIEAEISLRVVSGPSLMLSQSMSKNIVDQALLCLMKYCDVTVSPNQIRLCDRPDCKRLYLSKRALRKDVEHHFCSTECARRSATDAHRQRERNRNRKRYENKVRKRYPGAKIRQNKTRSGKG